jgi:hypothetical protein
MKKPPDYRTIKTSLKRITAGGFLADTLLDAVFRAHQIVFTTTHFLRHWILDKFTRKDPIPFISEDTFKMAFKACAETSNLGRKPEGANLILLNQFLNFHLTKFRPLMAQDYEPVSAYHLSRALGYAGTALVTAFETNIKEHFFPHVFRFVNSYFKTDTDKLLLGLSINDKKVKRIAIRKELQVLKDDLINNTSNSLHTSWLLQFRHLIMPSLPAKFTYEQYLRAHPQNFLPSLIYMSDYLESHDHKNFQFFPLRTESVPKYIEIDTAVLIELFHDNDNKLLSTLRKSRNQIWKGLFKFDSKPFKQKGHVFDYCISTDGIGVSIRFVKTKKFQTKEIQKDKMSDGRKASFKLKGELDAQQWKDVKDKKKETEIARKEEKVIEDDKDLQQLKQAYKAKPTDVSNLERDFPYVDKMNQEQLAQLKNMKLVYIDAGMNNILYMIDDAFDINDPKRAQHIIRYTNGRRLNETKRLMYTKERQKHRDKAGVSKLEQSLSELSKKTCKLEKFGQYIKSKFAVNEKVRQEYEIPFYRKLNWYAYINGQRSDAKLINEIKSKFGKKAVLIMGDWSQFGNLRCISTPGISLKRKLSKHFQVLSLDEFRTSKLNHKTEQENGNLVINNKKRGRRELHSVLTYKMENKRLGCINRDLNAVLNMRKIVDSYLQTGKKPPAFCRGQITPQTSAEVTDKTILPLYIAEKKPRPTIKVKGTHQTPGEKPRPTIKRKETPTDESVHDHPLKEPSIEYKGKVSKFTSRNE